MSEPGQNPPNEERPLPLDYRKPPQGTRLTALQLTARVMVMVVGVFALAFLVLLGTCALMR